MRNTKDKTIKKNYQRHWQFLVSAYQLVKKKKHPIYKTVKALCNSVGVSQQTFYKFYARYKKSKKPEDLLPQKRGPKWITKRPDPSIEQQVLEKRKQGHNRYDIYALLLPLLGEKTPSPSGIYNILKRHNMNRITTKQKEEKRRIIKTYAGELAHVDCHYLPKGLVEGNKKRLYLVGIIDAYSRLAWVEVVEDIKSLTVMFASLKSINFLSLEYGIKFEELLSDNGTEFSSRGGDINNHPYEKMLSELGIKHRYIQPYRPQTNGKIERFWKTIEEDVIEDNVVSSIEELRKQIQEYMFYYNEERRHQALKGLTPKAFLTKQNHSTN